MIFQAMLYRTNIFLHSDQKSQAHTREHTFVFPNPCKWLSLTQLVRAVLQHKQDSPWKRDATVG